MAAVGKSVARPFAAPDTAAGFVPVRVLPTSRDPARVRAFVDFQNDVTAKDIRSAVHQGMRSIEHVKRFTTNGMATDQGKTSNVHGLAIAAEVLGKYASRTQNQNEYKRIGS